MGNKCFPQHHLFSQCVQWESKVALVGCKGHFEESVELFG